MAGTASLNIGARATYRIRPSDLSKVLCHRNQNGREEYLVRWKTSPEFPVPPRAICSWHPLEELSLCLHHVQNYIDVTRTLPTPTPTHMASDRESSRKRKSPGSDPIGRNSLSTNGSLTPHDSAHWSREHSVISISSSSETNGRDRHPTEVYNGYIQKREGRITAKKSRDPKVTRVVNATKLPSSEMLQAAVTTPVTSAERLIREAFTRKLRGVPKVQLQNKIDTSTPSLDFTFIDEFVFREGTERAPLETNLGCQAPCKPNMGQNIGCEYTRKCSCLEYAAVDELALAKEDENLYEEYLKGVIETTGMPKKFPYKRGNAAQGVPSTLQKFYLEQRALIYECNANCNCGPVCKSRVVQKGRKVPLVIFKTPNRGWGVYCGEDLIKGEFIDTYLGEVITCQEADLREEKAGKAKASYLYSLDKMEGEAGLTREDCYVVDGQHLGGATRFINHSCEPNCRQYTVSYNKYDLKVYDLAFFAYQDIPAGTELTFDYMDKDEEEEEDVLKKIEQAAQDPENEDKKPCNCGARKCRGYLWV